MKNWRTTLAGIIGGAIPILMTVYERMAQGIPIDWRLVLLGIAIGALGVLAKDFNVTGGAK